MIFRYNMILSFLVSIMFSPRFDQLVNALRLLPSVGPKSAQRMALHLMLKNRDGALQLAHALQEASDSLHLCRQCHSLTEDELCDICRSTHRQQHLLCIVSSPADVLAIEQSGSFLGLYHVLTGHLSPLDGIGPEDIGIPHLIQRLEAEAIQEVILATNSTVEGEATAHYIVQACNHLNITMTRIAQGIPQGGELEYVGSHTLSQALHHRLRIN